MRNNLCRANKLFVAYHGNKFHMKRDNKLDEYENYNVPNVLEKEWANQYQKQLLEICKMGRVIDHNYMSLFIMLERYPNINNLHTLLEIIKNGSYDTFTKVRFAEELLHIINNNVNDNTKMTVDTINTLIKSVLEEDYYIDDYYINKYCINKYLVPNFFNKELIYNRAKRIIMNLTDCNYLVD